MTNIRLATVPTVLAPPAGSEAGNLGQVVGCAGLVHFQRIAVEEGDGPSARERCRQQGDFSNGRSFGGVLKKYSRSPG